MNIQPSFHFGGYKRRASKPAKSNYLGQAPGLVGVGAVGAVDAVVVMLSRLLAARGRHLSSLLQDSNCKTNMLIMSITPARIAL